MRGRQPARLVLFPEERSQLEALVRRQTTPQRLVRRARIVLLAAEGHTNAAIARQLGLKVDTVRRWRERWRGLPAASLTDLPLVERLTDVLRPGRPAAITDEQVCRIVALACEAPATSGRPISQWASREVADEIVTRGIVAAISPRHAARLLKKGISSPIVFGIG